MISLSSLLDDSDAMWTLCDDCDSICDSRTGEDAGWSGLVDSVNYEFSLVQTADVRVHRTRGQPKNVTLIKINYMICLFSSRNAVTLRMTV